MGVMGYGQSREVIYQYNLHPFLVFYLEIEFLEQENPPEKSFLSLLLSQKTLQSIMVCKNDNE